MTDEDRKRAFSVLGMDCISLGKIYRSLGGAMAAFGTRLGLTRPDACEAFFEEWRDQRARADAELDRIEQETFDANIGVTNDGPDRWSADLDRLNRGIVPK